MYYTLGDSCLGVISLVPRPIALEEGSGRVAISELSAAKTLAWPIRFVGYS